MKREYHEYLLDIFHAIENIEKFIQEVSKNDFETDEKTIFAVIRALEIIGEAAKKIPLTIKINYKKVPWKEMAGMRDKLIHEYFGVNVKVVWKTVKEEIPRLKPLIKNILKDFDKGVL